MPKPIPANAAPAAAFLTQLKRLRRVWSRVMFSSASSSVDIEYSLLGFSHFFVVMIASRTILAWRRHWIRSCQEVIEMLPLIHQLFCTNHSSFVECKDH